MAEHGGGRQWLLLSGAEGPVEGEQAIRPSVRRDAVIPARVSGEGLRGGLGMELRPLRHTERNHEGALDFDLDVRQRVKEFLVSGVLEAEGGAVGASHSQIRLHR